MMVVKVWRQSDLHSREIIVTANHTCAVAPNAQLSPGEQTGADPRLALLLAVLVGGQRDVRLAGEDIIFFQGLGTAWRNHRTPLFMSFVQKCYVSVVSIYLAYLRSWGSLQKHHEIFAAVRRPQLGVTCEPRPRHPHLPSGTPSGSLTRLGSSSHPVGLIRVALPEHASWGNLKTPSNSARPSSPRPRATDV